MLHIIYIYISQLYRTNIQLYKIHGVYKPTSNWGAHRLADISEISNQQRTEYQRIGDARSFAGDQNFGTPWWRVVQYIKKNG